MRNWLLVLSALLPLVFCSPAHAGRLFAVDTTDRVVSTDPLNPTGDLTVCAWLRLTGGIGDANARAVTNRNGADGTVGYFLGVESGASDDELRFGVAIGGTFRIAGPASGTDLSDGEWHFACGKYTAGATDTVAIWVDDMQSSAAFVEGTYGTYDDGVSNLAVGNNPDGSAGTVSWPGDIADVAVWKSGIVAADREIIKRGYVALYNPDVYYRLGVFSPEPDWSAGSKDGTVTGTTIGTSPPKTVPVSAGAGSVF